MCCRRLALNAGRKKSPKIRHLGTIAQLCRTISSQLRHVSTIGKNLLNSNMSSLHMSLQYGELRLTSGWDLLASLGHPSKFQRVLRLGKRCKIVRDSVNRDHYQEVIWHIAQRHFRRPWETFNSFVHLWIETQNVVWTDFAVTALHMGVDLFITVWISRFFVANTVQLNFVQR